MPAFRGGLHDWSVWGYKDFTPTLKEHCSSRVLYGFSLHGSLMTSAWSCVCFYSTDVNPQNTPLVNMLSIHLHFLDCLQRDSICNTCFVSPQNFYRYLFFYCRHTPIFIIAYVFLHVSSFTFPGGPMGYGLFSSYAKWSLEEVNSLYTGRIKT